MNGSITSLVTNKIPDYITENKTTEIRQHKASSKCCVSIESLANLNLRSVTVINIDLPKNLKIKYPK